MEVVAQAYFERFKFKFFGAFVAREFVSNGLQYGAAHSKDWHIKTVVTPRKSCSLQNWQIVALHKIQYRYRASLQLALQLAASHPDGGNQQVNASSYADSEAHHESRPSNEPQLGQN